MLSGCVLVCFVIVLVGFNAAQDEIGCVLVCFVIVLVGFNAAQDEIVSETTTELTTVTTDVTEIPVPLPDIVTDVICKQCNCSGGVVDCSGRELRRPFDLEDWNGLKNMDITEVDLSKNFFVSLTEIGELPIKKLNISYCELEILPGGVFSNLEDIVSLDLSRNKISFSAIGRNVFGIFHEGKKPKPFPRLRYLSLAHNDLHSLAQGMFMFTPHVTTLDLSGNPLAIIDQITMSALTDLTRLKELRISECDLEALPEGFLRRQRRLQRLDLSGNRFTTIPPVLSEGVNLLYLNFDRNPIQTLPKHTAISNLTRLQELHLSRHSNLRTISAGALAGLESLVVLHIRYNPRLTVIDPRFLEWEDELGIERWPLLEEFYLNNNNLSGITAKMLGHWDQLTKVDFSANPYQCDCSNQWMMEVLVPTIMKTVSNATTVKMVCRRPEDYRGYNFAQLYESRKNLVCLSNDNLTEASSTETAVLYGIMIGILVTFPIVLILVILWRHGYFARCRKKMNNKQHYFDEEETDAF